MSTRGISFTSAPIKDQARALIDALPEDATWQDVLYALELRSDIETGLGDANADRVTDTEALFDDYGLRR